MPLLTARLREHLASAGDLSRATAGGRRSAVVTVGRRKIPIDVIGPERLRRGRRVDTKPHLRFDRGAVGLLDRLRVRLADAVPAGTTVLVSVTAPIWQDSKTAAALEDQIRALLGPTSRSASRRAVIWGNQIRIQLHPTPDPVARVVGFVHNPETDPRVLFDMTRRYLELLATAQTAAGKRPAERWLFLLTDDAPSQLIACRTIASQCGRPPGVAHVLIRFRDGQIEAL